MRKYRKLLIITLSLVLVYMLVGFLLVPRIAQRRLVRIVDETLGLRASVERLRTNPFTFTVRADGFDLSDPDGVQMLGFDELFVNLQLSSLFRWAWTFKEIRLVNPRLEVIVDQDGIVNLASLIRTSKEGRDESAETGKAGFPRLRVYEFRLESGTARFEDRTRPTPFSSEIGPASIALNSFSTLPGDDGHLSFEAALESGAHLTWQGTIGVNPPHSEGRITVTDGHMPITKRYLQDTLRFLVTDGRSGGELNYAASFENEVVKLSLTDSSITVTDLVVTPEDDDLELLRLPELRLSGIDLEWPQQVLTIDEVAVTGLRLAAWRSPDGSFNLIKHLSIGAENDPEMIDEEAQDPKGRRFSLDDWQISLNRLIVEDLAVGVEDRMVDPPFRTSIDDLRLEVLDIDNAAGSTFDFDLAAEVGTGGSASGSGELGVLPGPNINATVTLDRLSLVPLQPYLDQFARIRLDSGAVSLNGRLTSNTEELLTYRGGVVLVDLACHDMQEDERLVGMGMMSADDLLFELTGAHLRIAALNLERPYGRLKIYEDGSTNVGDVLTKGTSARSDAGTTAPANTGDADLPLALEIGEVLIREGAADFSDLSLPLPFASRIDSLEGVITEMASGGNSSHVELEGTVDEYGMVRIEGSLDIFAPDRRSDVVVAFRNVEMKGLSPYSSKFAGYQVEEGRLSLDLRYRIEDRTLNSENEILIEKLTLGEKIDSPDAPNLPIKLGIAMLKDKDGNIELDIPVEGSLDNPEFAYGKLVWKLIGGVMKKLATAPFRALARLVGSDKDLEIVEFAPAEAEIRPPARETLEQLAQALTERPELALEVRGVFDPDVDAARIREQKLDARLAERVASQPPAEGAEPVLASERTRAALESLFIESLSQEELDALFASHTAPAEEVAEPVFNLLAYLEAVRERLAAAQPVSEEELIALADARTKAIGDFLASGGLILPERVIRAASEPIKNKDAGNSWVRLRLVVTAK